jgi:hypothetical protein
MSHTRQVERQRRNTFKFLAGMAGVLAFALLVYWGFSARAGWWRDVPYTVVGSRVAPDRVVRGTMKQPVILYRGEYRLRYIVNGQEYFTWADAGWINESKELALEKVEEVPPSGMFRVQYNPRNPTEAVARLR